MSNRATLPLALLLIAGVGRGMAVSPAQRHTSPPETAPPQQKPDGQEKPSQQKTRLIPTGRQLLEEFLALGAAPRGDSAGAKPARGVDSVATACLPPVGVVIATLPDPVDSHLDWAFDSDYEAIVRAYERTGFVVDRYWLPWSEKLDTLVAVPGGDPSRRLRDVYPGVVLFRRDTTQALAMAVAQADTARARTTAEPGRRGTQRRQRRNGTVRAAAAPSADAGGVARQAAARCHAGAGRGRGPDLQLLYIVGELPTGGVHKDALARALAEREQILNRAASPDVLRIVGPAFSGSARSLEVALRQWRTRDTATYAQVITGSATSDEIKATLERVPHLSFTATVHGDARLTAAFAARVLCPLNLGDDQVAVLRESGTSYGRDVVDGDAQDALRCPGTRRALHPSRFLVIPFPMNIASLRSQIEDHPRAQATDEPQSRVPVTLRDPERAGDKPAPTSQLTAPTLEVMLNEIEGVVTGQRIRAVGILASDVRDKLFLARELRRRLRDVQLFTYEGNALYLVPENNGALRGMLVVSTYPLALRTQWWTPGRLSGMRLSFPNEGAEGIHNAVLMQLSADSLAVDYGYPFLDRHRAAQVPPVWISAVGRSEFVPVTVDTVKDSTYVRRMLGTPPPARPWPTIQFFAAVAIVALGLGLVLSVRPFLPPWRRRPPVAKVDLAAAGMDREVFLDEVRWGSQNFHRAAYATLRTLALLGVFVPVAVVTAAALLRRRLFDGPGEGTRILLLVFLGLVLVVGLWGAARMLLGALRRLEEVRPLGLKYAGHGWPATRAGRLDRAMWWLEIVGRALVFVAGTGFFLLSVRFAWQIATLMSTRRITGPLLLARATALDSGVSPLLPLILAGAGYAVWCTWHGRRIAFLRESTPFEAAWHTRSKQPPRHEGATALPEGAEKWVRALRMRLFLVVPDPVGVAVLGSIVVLAVVLFTQIGKTLEGIAGLDVFDWILALSVTGSLVSICWAVYRLLAVWRALDHVLGHLAETPLVAAFRRLPPRVGQLTRLTLWRPEAGELVESVAASQWRQMKQLYDLSVEEFARLDYTYPGLAANVATYMKSEQRPRAGRIARRLVNGDHESFLMLDRILSPLWQAEPDPEVVKEIREELKKAPDENTGAMVRRSFPSAVRLWMRVAEEFAAVQVVDYIEWVLQQLRTLTVFLFVALLLTTGLLSSYPFQPQGLVRLVFLLVLLVTVGSLLYVMAALNRDDVLSMVANTDPGRISFDRTFVLNAVAVAVVPLLTLISTELPDWHILGFMDPILRIFGGH